jgi:hypothetical protein
MSAAANAPDPPTQPSRSANLLGLVRKLIDYGKELATTLQQRATNADLAAVTLSFGTRDIALILGLPRCPRRSRSPPRSAAGPSAR